MTIDLSINGCSHSQNQFDDKKQNLLVQKFGRRRLQRLGAIQAEPPSQKEALLAECSLCTDPPPLRNKSIFFPEGRGVCTQASMMPLHAF